MNNVDLMARYKFIVEDNERLMEIFNLDNAIDSTLKRIYHYNISDPAHLAKYLKKEYGNAISNSDIKMILKTPLISQHLDPTKTQKLIQWLARNPKASLIAGAVGAVAYGVNKVSDWISGEDDVGKNQPVAKSSVKKDAVDAQVEKPKSKAVSVPPVEHDAKYEGAKAYYDGLNRRNDKDTNPRVQDLMSKLKSKYGF
jgi:hypothetical protein